MSEFEVRYAAPTSVRAEKMGKPQGTYYLEVGDKITPYPTAQKAHDAGIELGLTPTKWSMKP